MSTSPEIASSQSVSHGRKSVWGWALYDFGNSAFTTLIVTFIYSVFFAQQIAPDGNTGTVLWANAIALTAIIVAVSSPFLGALADRGGHRRRYLLLTTVIAIGGSVLLYFPTPGEVRFALTVFVIANVAFELSGVFYNSYLPDISTPANIGKISGYGWSLGYVGGLLAMGIVLVGFILPESPWFGLATGEEGLFQNVRASTLVVALWFAVFALPMFRWVPELRHRDAPPLDELLRGTIGQLTNTFKEIRRYGQIARLLVARMIYNDGLVTILRIGTPVRRRSLRLHTYRSLVLGPRTEHHGRARSVRDGVPGRPHRWQENDSDLADRADDRDPVGDTRPRRRIRRPCSWPGWSSASSWAPIKQRVRSLLGRFVPPEKETEFYGFFAFSGKAIAFMGPLLYARMTTMFGSQRYGIGVIIVFFVVGGLILATVDEKAGMAASGRAA